MKSWSSTPDSLKVLNRWSLGSGRRPTGLALDREHRRLFSVCGASQTMVVLDADSGKILATLPIGAGSDGCVFDPERGLAFSSNGQRWDLDGRSRGGSRSVRRRRDHPHPAGCPDHDAGPEDAPHLPFGGNPCARRQRQDAVQTGPPRKGKVGVAGGGWCPAHSWSSSWATDRHELQIGGETVPLIVASSRSSPAPWSSTRSPAFRSAA